MENLLKNTIPLPNRIGPWVSCCGGDTVTCIKIEESTHYQLSITIGYDSVSRNPYRTKNVLWDI